VPEIIEVEPGAISGPYADWIRASLEEAKG